MDVAELCRTVVLQEQDWAPALVHILYSSITVCNIKNELYFQGLFNLIILFVELLFLNVVYCLFLIYE